MTMHQTKAALDRNDAVASLTPASLSPGRGTVIITGGSSGIGRCTASLYAAQGYRVGLIARGAAGLADAAEALRAAGGCVTTATADVADAGALARAADALCAVLGPPDLWINCAGNGVYGRFTSVPVHEYDRVTDVTYGGTVHGCRVALALMAPRGRGTIVNVCSAIAFHGMPLMSSYAGAKAAVRGFSQALQAELRMARSPIRVCVVFPPAVNTPFFSHAVSHMGWPARPANPVYQPELVAAGIMLAARRGRREMTLTGTASLFLLATRLAPWAIAWAMTKLGFDGQLTRDAAAIDRESPTLFAPSAAPSPIRGPFNRHARGWSSQLWFWRVMQAGAGLCRAIRLRPDASVARGALVCDVVEGAEKLAFLQPVKRH